MYEYLPPKNNKKASALSFLFMIGGAIIFILGTQLKGVIDFIWIFQIIGIFLCVVSIFIFSRYVTKSYIYKIETNGDLTVTELQGKKRITVCRISISEISSSFLFNASETDKINAAKKQIKQEKRKVYNYCMDIKPQKLCYIFSEEYEDIAIILQPDDRLFEYLKKD